MSDDDRKMAESDLECAREAVKRLESASFLDQTDLIGPRILVGRLNQYAVPIFGLTPEVVDIIDRFNRILEGFPFTPGMLIRSVRVPGSDTPSAPSGPSIDGNESASFPLRSRQELILVAVEELGRKGPGPWRAQAICKQADLTNDSRARTDLSELHKEGFLRNDGAGYTRTAKSYPGP
jgi:hypothetical protein